MARPAARLWKASFTAPADAMPALLESLEALALSVSIFEDDADAEMVTTRWRVELLFNAKPDRDWLAGELASLTARFGFRPGLGTVEPVADENWLAVTAMQGEPLAIGRYYVHGAAHRGRMPPGLLPIQVEAGLAFGSGEHATTQACLQALGQLPPRPHRRMLDLGCGSAVLAIAAARRWPGTVLAVDNDAVAVRVAAENVATNGLSGRIRTAVSEGWNSSVMRRRAPYDLVLSNILADPLIEMAADLARHLLPGGTAVLSGFIARDAPRVAAAHRRQGLRWRRTIERQGWAAIAVEAPRLSARRLPTRRS